MRLLAVAAIGAGAVAWFAWPRRAQAAALTYAGDPEEALPFPPPEPPPFPPPEPPPEPRAAPSWSGGDRISPADVVALLPFADPEGWMPAADALAFVQVESAFRTRAYRWEAHLGTASYGLMQVLETTARDRDPNVTGPAMYDPLVSLAIGIAHARWSHDYLARRLGREPTEAEWVGSYNAGVGNVLRGFIPWAYVRRWQAARDRFAGVA